MYQMFTSNSLIAHVHHAVFERCGRGVHPAVDLPGCWASKGYFCRLNCDVQNIHGRSCRALLWLEKPLNLESSC